MYRVFSLVLVVLQAAAPPTTTITTIHHQCLPLPYNNWNGMTSHQLYIQVIISNANSIKILYYDISRLRSLTYSILLDTTIQQQIFDTQHQTIIQQQTFVSQSQVGCNV